jgi:hypothetical protein
MNFVFQNIKCIEIYNKIDKKSTDKLIEQIKDIIPSVKNIPKEADEHGIDVYKNNKLYSIIDSTSFISSFILNLSFLNDLVKVNKDLHHDYMCNIFLFLRTFGIQNISDYLEQFDISCDDDDCDGYFMMYKYTYDLNVNYFQYKYYDIYHSFIDLTERLSQIKELSSRYISYLIRVNDAISSSLKNEKIIKKYLFNENRSVLHLLYYGYFPFHTETQLSEEIYNYYMEEVNEYYTYKRITKNNKNKIEELKVVLSNFFSIF